VATLSIRLFGPGSINRTDAGAIDVPDILWPVVGCVFAMPGRRMTRSRLAGQLWPDKEEGAARHCLANALWRIKARLPEDPFPLSITEDWIGFREDRRIWVDSLVFEHRASAALARPEGLAGAAERRRLARALGLYRSDFLLDLAQDAITLERERLRALYLDAQYELAMAQAKGLEWAAARSSASVLCLAEPLREDAQRLLMIATARCGNRAMALRLFQSFESLLARELGVPPMPETVAVMRDIAGPGPITSTVGGRPPADYRGALVRTRDQITQMLHMVEEALAQ
jgi:DNA-binding SARP family transcriptional activator